MPCACVTRHSWGYSKPCRVRAGRSGHRVANKAHQSLSHAITPTPAIMPSLAELEEWMEEQIPQNLHELPMRVHATLQAYSAQLYEQLMEITPTLSQIESSLSTIVNPPSSQPPPPPPQLRAEVMERTQRVLSAFIERVASPVDRLTGNRHRTSIVAGIALTGLSYTLARRYMASRRHVRAVQARLRIPRTRNGARIDAVVVLGADTAVGQVLCHALAAQGFIVMGSVSNEQSKQSFDSLVPPSMRGYIKTIILPANETQTEHISQFVRTLSAARQLRWPLTAAGDPYARAGSEIDIVAVVNALSYVSPLDDIVSSGSGKSTSSTPSSFAASTSSLDVNRLADDLQRRVVTPLATMRALLPILNSRHAAQDDGASSPPILLSLTHPGGLADIAAKALASGMHAMTEDEQTSDLTTFYSRRRAMQQDENRKRRVNILSLEAHPTTFANVFYALIPDALGGTSILSVPLPDITFFRRFSSRRSPAKVTKIETTTSILSDSKSTRSTRSSSSVGMMKVADLRNCRQEEHQLVVRAALQLLARASVSQGAMRRSTYMVRLPASHTAALIGASTSNDGNRPADASTASHNVHFEPTFLARAVTIVSIPVYAMGRALNSITSILMPFRPYSCYSGTRNQSNNRPAFGPGPGPASNTHSRSCIRSSTHIEQDSGARKRARPVSTASATSSDHARSSESEHAAASRPASSGPPSNPDMSSSGILSSVPSSAFGDASEEDHYGDSDYVVEGIDSPVVGGRAGSNVWQSEPGLSNSGSDHDDSGTALGARNTFATQASVDDTPHASRVGSGDATSAYGFPSHESMQSADEERPWMGPHNSSSVSTAGDVGSSTPAASGVQSPLGQSWVALGQSSTQQ